MPGSKACVAALAIGIVIPLGAAQLNERESSARFNVCLYDYASLSAETLTKSEIEVNRIFHRAGVGLSWLQWVPSTAKLNQPATCGDNRGLVLKLISDQMAAHFHPLSKELGFAAGTQAWVFVDRVRTASEYHDFFIILGDVMAHELGHLLLGPGHSPSGIMCASYRQDTLLNAEFGRLLFTPEQAYHLQSLMFHMRPKASDSKTLRSSLQQTLPDRQYALALQESSRALAPSDALRREDR